MDDLQRDEVLSYLDQSGEEQTLSNKDNEILQLRQELQQAAEAGLALMESNKELHEKYESDMLFYQEQIENLKQENYSLSNKLYLHTSTHQAFLDELDQVKCQTEAIYEKKIKMIEHNHQMKLQQLMLELNELERELEKDNMEKEKMNTKISSQEQFINKLKEELSNTNTHEDFSDEMSELDKLCKSLKCENEELKTELCELSKNFSYISEQYDSSQSTIKELEESLREHIKISNESYRGLQEAQESNVILQSQLEKFKLEKLEENWQNFGNSLFSEVEEKRLETERKYISLQVKYETLERAHEMLKQHFRKLKAEMSALLCRYSTSTADAAHIERLQRTLQQRNSEIQRLTDRINTLERQHSGKYTVKVPTEILNEEGYISYLKQQISDKDKSLCEIRHELDLKTTQLVWENTKLSESESKLHHCEQDKAKLINDATKIRIKLSQTTERENELKVHIKALEKEVMILKDQLKNSLRKGHLANEDTATATISAVKEEETNAKPSSPPAQKVIREPVNLLEELEKHTNIKTGVQVTQPLSLSSANEQENYNPNDNAIPDATNDDSVNDMKNTSTTATTAVAAKKLDPSKVTVVKVRENVNQCPQQ